MDAEGDEESASDGAEFEADGGLSIVLAFRDPLRDLVPPTGGIC